MRPMLPVILLGGCVATLALSTLNVTQAASAKAADSRNEVISKATPHDRLLSVAFDGEAGIAVGDGGLLQTSSDGGKTWIRERAPTELAMTDVAISGARTIVVGQMGLILIKQANGDWRQVDSGTDRRLLRVDINQSGLAVVVGAFGTLLKSTDAGETWASAAPDWSLLYAAGDGDMVAPRDEPTNYVVHVAEDGQVLIGGEYGQLMRSKDAGPEWNIVYRYQPKPHESAPTIFGMSIRDDGVGYAVGQSGFVARTTDNGLSWQVSQTPVTGSLFGVASFPNGQVVAVGQRASLRSTDAGVSWRPIEGLDFALNWYSSVGHSHSAPEGEFIAVGHSARILRLNP